MSKFPVTVIALLLTILLYFVSIVSSLYPDQVGKWDWHLSFTGHAKKIIPLHTEYSSNPSFILASHLQVLSSIHLRNGSIAWRHIYESRKDTNVWNIVQLDAKGSLLRDVSSSTEESSPSLITVTAGGRYIRSWDAKLGTLNWEKSLPENLISSEAIFSLDILASKLIHIRTEPTKASSLVFSTVDLSSMAIDSVKTVPLKDTQVNWESCTAALPYILVCTNEKQIVTISSTGSINVPFAVNPAVDSDEKLKCSDVQVLYTNEHSTESLVSVKTNDKLATTHLIKVSQDGTAKLLESIRNVDAVTLSKDNSNQLVVFYLMDGSLNAYDISAKFTQSSSSPCNRLDHLTYRLPKGSRKVKSLHVLFFSSAAYKILVVNEDESIQLFSKTNDLAWTREEALSDITATGFVDLPSEDKLIGHTFVSTNLPQQFIARIASQVEQLQTCTLGWIKILSRILEGKESFSFSTTSSSHLASRSRRVTQLDTDEPLKRDYFGLRKLILLVTSAGKIFSLDTISGSIVWSHYLSELKGVSSLSLYVHRSHVTIVTVDGLVISLNGVTGAIGEKKNLPSRVLQSMQLPQADRPVCILLSNGQYVLYPPSSKMERNVVYLVTLDTTSGLLTGLQLYSSTPKAQVAWTLSIPGANQLIAKRPFESVHSQGRVLGDRNVLYKYLNPNLMVVTVEKATLVQIEIHLIDAVSGRVIYSSFHRKCRGPIFVVHSENSVIYTYYNDRNRRHDMSVIDLYEGLTQVNSTAFSSFDRVKDKQTVHHSSFIFPTAILAMADTVTEKGITNKHIILALPNGGLLELPKAFIDARRPLHPTPEHREEGLIPYLPELPIPSEGFINYNKSILAAKGITVSPSGLESTCLVFAYGLDAFFTRVMPSKTFDILKDDFDHLLIAAVLLALSVLAYASKWLSARKTLRTAWA